MYPGSLQEALHELSASGIRPAIAAPFAAGLAEYRAELAATIAHEIPAYGESRNPAIGPQLEAHIADHLAEIHRLLGGARSPRLEFVRRHAGGTAEQNFPLEAVLHTYRTLHRLLGRHLRTLASETALPENDREGAIAAVADFAVEYTDAVSTIAASEYVRSTRRLSAAEADRRSQLLSVLLSGYDESDGRVARLLRAAGYLDHRQAFCVVLARSVDPAEMQNAARANRLLAALREALDALPVKALYGYHDHRVVAVLSAARRLSGWTAPQTVVADRVGWPLLGLGNAVVAGISADAPSTALLPRALREAELALELTDPAHRVVEYAKIPLRRLLLHLAEGRAQSALPAWTAALLTANDRSRGVLITTLRAYADADMNVQAAAKALAVHPNTIYARMQKVRDATGQDPFRFHSLTELLLAVDFSTPSSPA